MPWVALLPALFAAAGLAADLPEPLLAMLAAPALLWLPGRGLAWRLVNDPLERVVAAFWISAVLLVPCVLLGVWTDLGGAGTLAAAATITAASERIGRGAAHPVRPLDWAPRMGVAFSLLVVAGLTVSWDSAIARPLDRAWWFPPAESAWEDHRETVMPTPGAGWKEADWIGWKDSRAMRLEPRASDPTLLGPAEGPLVIAIRGPVGATLEVEGRSATITATVEEVPEEGPVPRYLGRGVAALLLEPSLRGAQRLDLRLSRPAHSEVYLLGGPDAVWALHGAGKLRFIHYYQILNMVEQVHWARELYADRRVTDVQPPLPSYVLAAPIAVTDGELPTANVVFLLELLMLGVAGVAAIRAWAPEAPLPAWLLPGAALAMHGKLMLEPSSAMLPDTLYALAIVGTITALARRGPAYPAYALLAQLTRYPGSLVAAIAGLLAGAPRRVVGMLACVVGTAGLFAIGGALSGSLDGWLETVWWETFPEHWHGESDPAVLLARAPRFYGLWVAYAGALPVLAALRWPKGTRVALGTALLYSLLLCTIDHTPSHYFLPLLHLSAVAAACTASAFGTPAVRLGIPIAGLVGIFVATEWVPVVG